MKCKTSDFHNKFYPIIVLSGMLCITGYTAFTLRISGCVEGCESRQAASRLVPLGEQESFYGP